MSEALNRNCVKLGAKREIFKIIEKRLRLIRSRRMKGEKKKSLKNKGVKERKKKMKKEDVITYQKAQKSSEVYAVS